MRILSTIIGLSLLSFVLFKMNSLHRIIECRDRAIQRVAQIQLLKTFDSTTPGLFTYYRLDKRCAQFLRPANTGVTILNLKHPWRMNFALPGKITNQ
jgi:hypothetical protein